MSYNNIFNIIFLLLDNGSLLTQQLNGNERNLAINLHSCVSVCMCFDRYYVCTFFYMLLGLVVTVCVILE